MPLDLWEALRYISLCIIIIIIITIIIKHTKTVTKSVGLKKSPKSALLPKTAIELVRRRNVHNRWPGNAMIETCKNLICLLFSLFESIRRRDLTRPSWAKGKNNAHCMLLDCLWTYKGKLLWKTGQAHSVHMYEKTEPVPLCLIQRV